MANPDWDRFYPYVGLLFLATVSIYCGAFGSLPAPRDRIARKQSLLLDEGEYEGEVIPDRLTANQAWLFPIAGSAVLLGMYLVVRYMGAEWINWLLGWYFSIAGVVSVWGCTVSLAKLVIGRKKWSTFERYRFVLLEGPLEVANVGFRTPTLMLLPVGMVPSILYNMSGTRKSVLWTDVLALSFSHCALSILKLDSFRTGCILLTGLFFYDVYWVFGTEVMVKVATSLDVPIKLLWAKTGGGGSAMLGLGDVVIPGIFIGLALRYDHARAKKTDGKFRKPYFQVTLTGYVLGLITAMGVMCTFGKAQPALLYLSPGCIVSMVGTAVVRGELEDAWRWSDDPEEGGGLQKGKEQPNNGADGDGHEITEGDGEEGRHRGVRDRSHAATPRVS